MARDDKLIVSKNFDKTAIADIIERFKKMLGRDISFTIEKKPDIVGGFIAIVDDVTFDGSMLAKLESQKAMYPALNAPQRKRALPEVKDAVKKEYFEDFIKQQAAKIDLGPQIYSSGRVRASSDGIVQIEGLAGCRYGELVLFENDIYGMAFNLESGFVGAVLLADAELIKEGAAVKRTGMLVEVPVGETLLGRVVSPLGQPLDGKGRILVDKKRKIEMEAPGIIDREPVSVPLQTGLLAIDSMIPIGRGQRELIIGDRQTGKTAIVVDTILNQKHSGVICIYVAIGQKASTVSQVVKTLTDAGAMDYTIIVSATASDSTPLQYIAPYAGCTMAEEFMYGGRDVLVIYDDLSKHAVAYRTISLLMRRPPGREAYPGDVFYLHSRLLERAAKLKKEHGGGSMTALPIVETQAGDISAYIPTNVISITDGQIYLESELFYSGIRPAVNVGLSVSRVGSSAQTLAMKKVSSRLRMELAQYRELAVFSQFSSDLDASAKEMLAQGEKLTETLKQVQYTPLPMAHQVIMLYVVTKKYLIKMPGKYVRMFHSRFIDYMETNYPDVIRYINERGDFTEDLMQKVDQAAAGFKQAFIKEFDIEEH
ncbi:MAG: F0F1 ATP synthase subunit alpha [Bacillota bacterium]|nr:F0F1 ATP synthase subunit alpha [Bacillota bacterium]